MTVADRWFDATNNWEKDTICSEIEVVKEVKIAQNRVDCPWCDKAWNVIVDKSVIASGIMFCSNCGKFFRWVVNHFLAWYETRRVIPRPTERKTING